MTPVIQAHCGGLFCAGWTPEGRGLVYHSPSEGVYAHSAPILPTRGLLLNVRALSPAGRLEQTLESRRLAGALSAV